MDLQQWLGVGRHVLTTVGGIFVAKGVIGESEVEALAGAIVTIAGIVLSIINKRRKA